MNTGIGFTEILFVLFLVLVFFGSKELPMFLREAGKIMAKLRSYSDQVRSELDQIARSVEPAPPAVQNNQARQRKDELRATFRAARKALIPEHRDELSARIAEYVLSMSELERARAVMVYLHTPTEVRTDRLIARLQNAGKRIVVPYCRESSRDLGIAEITDVAVQTRSGAKGIREPFQDFRENILKSDIGLVICPGVAFDHLGGRLGRGYGYYDNFLREILGRVPFVGLAFSCQIAPETFPFDYHDVPMTQVISENGPLIDRKVSASPAG